MPERKPKIKDNISPLDVVFLISVAISIIMSILALALEPGLQLFANKYFRYANEAGHAVLMDYFLICILLSFYPSVIRIAVLNEIEGRSAVGIRDCGVTMEKCTGFLVLVITMNHIYSNAAQSGRAQGGTAMAVIAMLLLFTMFIMEVVVFFTCRARYKGFLIGLITLGCFSTVLFIVGAVLNYDRTPHFGAWLIAACCLSFISSIITVIDHCTDTVYG
ncbi:hypothetical protein D915_006383 [Fasciola hepatica]|uniref:Uncharacterized protein n=1 Tax=Fasciola hepatica TaxID=6192 RepID=A0A4E0R6B6_FASHE|nr:hypothetical protein D915_006383 [Fasciola hepatica]